MAVSLNRTESFVDGISILMLANLLILSIYVLAMVNGKDSKDTPNRMLSGLPHTHIYTAQL